MTRTARALVLAATAFAVAAAPLVAHAHERRPFTDQRGVHFNLDDLRGAPLVLTFVSAHCSDACPLIEAEVAAAAARAQSDQTPTRFLTLTLDPEHDTHDDMKRIAQRFDARAKRWIIASGNARAIHALMRELHVTTTPDSSGIARFHNVFVYVFDARGRLTRAFLPSTDLTTQLVSKVAM